MKIVAFMDDPKIPQLQLDAEQAVVNGDADRVSYFITNCKDAPFVKSWKDTAKARGVNGKSTTIDIARTVIALQHSFNSWHEFETFKEEIAREDSPVAIFERAVDAVVGGDTETLTAMLQQYPYLVYSRSMRNHRATLLNYVGANGVEGYRQKTPPNAVQIAELLLKEGAEVDAVGDMYRGTTTLGLVATSVHPVKAGLQQPLMDVLFKYGANPGKAVAADYTSGLLILACLHNGRREPVQYLAQKGAALNLEAAAGAGRLDVVKKYFDEDGNLAKAATREQMNTGCMWACEGGYIDVVDFLLEKGFELNTVSNGMTALHSAAAGGQVQMVKKLIALGAPLEIENSFGGTVLGQTIWFAFNHPKPQYPQIIDILVHAGAVVKPGWDKYIEEIKAG